MAGTTRLDRSDLEAIDEFREGVPFVTLLHPDAACNEIKLHRNRVANVDGQRSGRPRKTAPKTRAGDMKRRRLDLRPQAQKLKAAGSSYHKISRALNVPVSTLQRWL